MKTKGTSFRQWRLRWVIPFLVSVAVILIAQEYTVRFVLPQVDPAGHLKYLEGSEGKPRLGIPNSTQRQVSNTGDYDITVSFNKYGLRDTKDLSLSTKEDLFVVGDSVPFGWGVEEERRFTNVLQQKIRRRVYNISMNGSFVQYERLLNYAVHNGAEIKNLLIVVNLGNDLKIFDEPNLNLNGTDVSSNNKEADDGTLQSIKATLLKNSAIYFATTTIVHNSPVLKSIGQLIGLIKQVEDLRVGTDSDQEKIDSSLARLTELLSVYPAHVLVVPSILIWRGDHSKSVRGTHSNFVEGLQNAGISYTDILPYLERTTRPLAYHFNHDAHWNEKGHRLAATILAKEIKYIFRQ